MLGGFVASELAALHGERIMARCGRPLPEGSSAHNDAARDWQIWRAATRRRPRARRDDPALDRRAPSSS